MIVRVAGVQFRDGYPDALLDLEEYMDDADEDEPKPKVTLKRDPNNEHDPNAIKVLVPILKNEQWVGHIPGDLAMDWAVRLDEKRKYVAFVKFVPISSNNPLAPGLEIDVRWAKK